jgi:hypothetical protein
MHAYQELIVGDRPSSQLASHRVGYLHGRGSRKGWGEK